MHYKALILALPFAAAAVVNAQKILRYPEGTYVTPDKSVSCDVFSSASVGQGLLCTKKSKSGSVTRLAEDSKLRTIAYRLPDGSRKDVDVLDAPEYDRLEKFNRSPNGYAIRNPSKEYNDETEALKSLADQAIKKENRIFR